MSKVGTVWVLALVGGIGLGLTYVYAPLGVGVSFLAMATAYFANFRLNVPPGRLGVIAAVLLNAGAIHLATGSWPLAAAAAVMGVGLPIHETVMRHARSLLPFQGFLAMVAAGGIVLAAPPAGWAILALVPNVLFGLMCSGMMLFTGKASAKARSRARLEVGASMPDVDLPFREGGGRFSLAEHRGKFVLLCFVRGDWCPVCQVLMRIISRQTDTLTRHGVTTVLISPSEGPCDDEMMGRIGLRTGMLVDQDAALARSIGIIERQEKGKDVPLPVAVLVDPQGIIRSISGADDVSAYASERGIARTLALYQRVAA